jgi:hypothetical protein
MMENKMSSQWMEPPEYTPFDQDRKLPPKPWKTKNMAANDDLEKWESAHGHDVRLKCSAEFGCLVIEGYAYWCGYIDGKNGHIYNWDKY